MKRCSLLLFACIMGGTLAGCAATPTDAPPTIAPPAPATTPAAEQDAPADLDSTDVAPGSSCLHGTWLADNAFFLARIQELGDEVHDVSGRVLLRFEGDGTLTTDYQGWTITARSHGLELQVTRAGVDTGRYSATEGTVNLSETHMGSTLTLKHGDLEMAIEPTPALYDNAVYSCDRDAASIVTADGELRLSRQ